jgi:polyhydroxybutyrate depolymerase
MNSTRKALLVTLLLFLTPAAIPAGAERLTSPGNHDLTLRHDGATRAYLVHVPRSYRSDRPTALVVALHGGGGSRHYQADDSRYGLISKSEQAGFIVVFPNGSTRLRSGMLATWNAGDCCARARDRNVDHVGFLRGMVEDLTRRMNIDRQRVFAIGMSNGAMMAYRLACEASDVFKGIMAVAGTDNTRQCAPRHPVPVLHVHARNDDHVLFNGGAGQVFRRESQVADFTSVPATVSRWVQRNLADQQARRVLEVPGAWCELHAAGPDGAPVKLCVTERGGHSWPGGQKHRGDEAPSQAIRASDLMWDFFS